MFDEEDVTTATPLQADGYYSVPVERWKKKLAEDLKAEHISIDEVLSKLGLDGVDPDAEGVPVKNFIKANEAVIPQANKMLQLGKVVIFDACFYHKEVIDHLIDSLPFPHYVFDLKVPVEICIMRDKGRSLTYGEDAARVAHMFVSQFDYGIPIDAGGTLKSAVDAIYTHLSTSERYIFS